MFGWMALLFVTSLGLGVIAVLAGVGGGVVFVPLVAALFPIHIDFVRGTGLLVALTGAISAAPRLLDQRLSRVRIAVPLALFGSAGSIIGARFGLGLEAKTVTVWLGAFMLVVAAVTVLQSRRNDTPTIAESAKGLLVRRWDLVGHYHDPLENADIHWQAKNVFPSMIAFVAIGFVGGVFGVGAGWANVPVLTLLMGLPLKLAAATSGLIIVVNSSAAASVYLARGAIEPTVAVPAIAGMVVGTRIGARLLRKTRPSVIRVLVILVLVAAGLRSLTQGLGG